MERRLEAQIIMRGHRRLESAIRFSRLPAVETLGDFDFAFQPSVRREEIEILHELGFLAHTENVVFPGPPGVGKTHLAISLAITAARVGRRVYYGTHAELVELLLTGRLDGELKRRLKLLMQPALLIVDEIGCLPLSHDGATLFFQLVNPGCEGGSAVLTSNKGFEEWGTILGDDVMAAALIDRLLHHCHIVNIQGNSYRIRNHFDLLKKRAEGTNPEVFSFKLSLTLRMESSRVSTSAFTFLLP